MSKELEFWRALQNESNIAEAFDRGRAEEMRAARGVPALLFNVDRSVAPLVVTRFDGAARSVAPLVVTRFDGAAADPYDPGGATLHLSMANECGREHRAYMPGSMVRLIQAPEKARADRAEAYESSELRDKCGALARENRDVLAENARLRRRIEDLERKGKKR